MTAWMDLLVSAIGIAAAAVALLALVRSRQILRRANAAAYRMDLLWRQVRGCERLDAEQREQLGRSLYAQFDPHGLPWDDLDGATRGMWHHQADRIAVEVTALFVARSHRAPQEE